MRKLFALTLVVAALGFSRTATPVNQSRAFQILVHNINQVEMSISNFGKFGQTSNGAAGLWWPVGSGHNYIFGAGSWFGTISGSDTMVTIGYGPHGGEAEYGPGLGGWVTSDPRAVIYMYPTNWPPPNGANDFPMAPTEVKSHQDSWCAYNDLDATWHMPGDTKPIGLEVYQTVYAWNLSTTQDIIFIRYETKNISGAKLTNCYFGVACDNDIGNESGTSANDRISGIVGQWFLLPGDTIPKWVDNLGYQWQEAPEAGWAEFPGVIGFDYLQSPWDLVAGENKDGDSIPDEHEMDSAWICTNLGPSNYDVDGDGTPDWRDPSEIPQMGMTAFKRFTLNLEPNKDDERYVTLAGYNFKTGAYEPFNDTLPPAADDQRFLQCSGPFELDTNATATVMVAVMLASWYDGAHIVRPDTALVRVDNMAQFIYDMNWLLPGPPPPPNLTCVPGDKSVTLVWDNLSETTPDPYYKVVHFADPSSPVYDPFYLEYDFQGYSIYKSKTALAGTWEKLASFDKYDGIIQSWPLSGTDTIQAVDNGLAHSYTDQDVRNGFTYSYAVAAFDWNQVKETDSTARVLMFQSGYVPVAAVPRREPVNYIPGSFMIESESGNPALATNNIEVKITYPLQMTTDPMYLEFGSYLYDSSNSAPIYRAYLVDNAGNYIDTTMASVVIDASVAITAAPYEFEEFHGLSVMPIFKRYNIPTNVSIFDTVIVTGSYPDSLVQQKKIATNWAYRGNDYEVTWIKAHGSDSVNSVTVVDLITGETIPYKAGSTDTLADGWCFRKTTAPQYLDTLVYAPGAAPNGTRSLYICGGEVNLKRGPDLKQGDPRPGEGDVWTLRAAAAYLPAPISARIKITPTPAAVRTDSTFTLNVKVVPNPYIIANEWQQSFRLRRLRFINLPSTCTVRIFNLNGELVKTITHTNNMTSDTGTELSNFTGGDEWWDLLSENRQLVASGIYVFHVQSDVGEQVGKFVVVR
jgi:hypothetical protein